MRTYRSNFNPYNVATTSDGSTTTAGFTTLSTTLYSLEVNSDNDFTGVQPLLNNLINNIGKTSHTEYNIILSDFKMTSTDGDVIEIPYLKLNLYALDDTAKVSTITLANFSISVFVTNETAYIDFLRDDSKQEVEMAYSISGDAESGIAQGTTVSTLDSTLKFNIVKIYAL